MSEKKLGGHRACLGDNVKNVVKLALFLLNFRGESGASFTKVGLDRTNFKLSN